MAQYDVHFLDSGDRVVNALELEHDTDEAAIEHADRLYFPSIGAGFDVLQGKRLVHRRRRAAPSR